MLRAYGLRPRLTRHDLADADVVALALAVLAGVWQGVAAVMCVAGGCGLLRRRMLVVVLCLLLGAAGQVVGERAWHGTHPRHLGPFAGWAVLAGDPTPFGRGLRVTFEVEGERFDAWLYGAVRGRLETHQAGEVAWLAGERVGLRGSQVRRAATRHVVGRLEVIALGDVVDGTTLARATNRVRSVLRRVAGEQMSADEAALFTGLVLGDDARQPTAMVADFRSSGLSHLTAVSGQNVAFLLAALAPLLRRLRRWWRWATTCAVVGWFMTLTRFEPSVLRAGVMAMLAATAFAVGRQAHPVRLLALGVTGLVLIDPLLVWSVGFWLSVGATAGVCLAAPWLTARLPGPLWLRAPLAVTLGAQLGVALPSLLVFGRLPVVSVAANLAAVPAAGFVMLYGIPAALAAALLPAPIAAVIMVPARLGTRWVATVARVAAAVEPHGRASVGGWALLLALVVGVTGRRWWRARRGVPI